MTLHKKAKIEARTCRYKMSEICKKAQTKTSNIQQKSNKLSPSPFKISANNDLLK